MFGWKRSTDRRGFIANVAAIVAALGSTGRRDVVAQAKSPAHPEIGRRVVTGYDKNGKSIIAIDGAPPGSNTYVEPGVVSVYNAWILDRIPADLSDSTDPAAGKEYASSQPPPGGAIMRMTTWFPGFKYQMHKTDSIDFMVVISGRIELGLEVGSTILGPGDFLVQRGTPHSWKVVGDQPCTFAVVLVDASRKTQPRPPNVK